MAIGSGAQGATTGLRELSLSPLENETGLGVHTRRTKSSFDLIEPTVNLVV